MSRILRMLSLRTVVKVLEQAAISGSYSEINHLQIRNLASYVPNIVRPVAIRNTNRKKNEPINFDNLDVEKVRKDFHKELKHEFAVRGDIGETDLDVLTTDSFDDMQREYVELRSQFRKNKMYRKHFKGVLDEKEISVLTYAEKEKIRYLHSTNPEEWTPETLSLAFPISPNGVSKLVKSSYRAKSIQDIQAHDKLVAERIESIKRGEIDMTPDLQEKMKIRDKIPLHVGFVDQYDKNMLLKMEPVKFIGEFQRLVSSPLKPDSETNSVSLLSDERVRSSSLMRHQQGSETEPDLGDFYYLEGTPETNKELRKMKVSLNRHMTFTEFKSKMKLEGGAKSRNQEIQHLAALDDNSTEPVPTSLSEFEQDEGNQVESNNRVPMQKFKQRNNENVQENSNRTEPSDWNNIRSRDHHHQVEDRINIPIGSTKKDIYQKGNSFYDETGEFIYKVI